MQPDTISYDSERAGERAEEIARIEAIVAQWGEPFRKVAQNSRFEFNDDTITIHLWKRITVGGEEVTALHMVEPTLEELKKLDGVRGDMSQAQRIIISTCSVTDRESGKIGMRDLALFGLLVEAFSGGVPATGSTL